VTRFYLKFSSVGKRFPGVVALDNVSLNVRTGEIHALLGENGAGKSTLLKILAGAQYQDSGTIDFEGKPLGRAPPRAPTARHRTVYQEFALMPNLSVAENILVGREPVKRKFISWPTMLRETKKVIDKLELRTEPLTPLCALNAPSSKWSRLPGRWTSQQRP
jgi:inositol transport system ATP-binding protein